MVYGFKEEGEFFDAKVQFAVSAPKRNFKKAVDRNRIKRLVREAYRLNKSILKIESDTPLAIMVIYTAKTIEPYSKIESSIVKVLELLNSKIQSNAT